jgi:transmembrane sensor
MSEVDRRTSEAIGWLLRLRDPQFEGWGQFTDWLENEDNAKAYRQLSLADADVGDVLEDRARSEDATNDNALAQRSRSWRHGWAAGLAAAIVIGVTSYSLFTPRASSYEVGTAAAEHRDVVLADGSRVELNGSTLLVMNRSRPRSVTLQRGEAIFTVKHDAADPFTVRVGALILQDVGTIFNVARGDGWSEVSVAEGAIRFNHTERPVTLRTGQTLRANDDGRFSELGEIDLRAVGAWRQGQLIYRGAPLSRIAADLKRNIGENVTVSPEVANGSFSGTIKIDKDRALFFRKLEGLLVD